MLVVRPAVPADIDALMELAFLSGRGFTSLPEDRIALSERLALSEASFAGKVDKADAWYVLMLEDVTAGRIDGVAGIKGMVGFNRPHFSFRIMTLAQYSSAIGTRFDHQALVLVNECTGWSEVGSLFLRPGKRQSGAGSLLARARYMLMGAEKERFSETIMSELRGWFDDADNSPFWDGIASKFFRLPFEEADRMITGTDGQFILDLAPRHPIYVELVDSAAREAIGAVHRHGIPALHLLEREGFSRSGLIDIFDGGPTMTCRRDTIRTVADARTVKARIADGVDQDQDALPMLASTDGIARFRAVRVPVRLHSEEAILSHNSASLLQIGDGARIRICS
ncbi:arginine succinyltransferase [Novosphingobium sp. CF614]|uniref:arginine N-succinyltransferase n=1 Tax=Novosphingobium sp. CF614 TaxID=1884364 RepID=UPI0008E977A1|nr:arginine N-succinyltransferase [Novosphingobium sp. CF614]SFG52658.1 arginine succinyltransferase [Novosphingobium sp. CF614]